MPTKKITASKKSAGRFYATRNADGTFAKISEVSPRAGAQREKTKRDTQPENLGSEPDAVRPAGTSKEAILALAGKYQGTPWWDEYEAAIEEARSEQCAEVAEG